MKTLVLYKSKAGFTKRYAQWIAEALNADLFEADQVKAEVFSSYDTVIYGGGLYAVGINGVKLITRNMERLSGKKVVVFATGASPGREEIECEVKNKNFTAEQQQQIRFFYLRGGFDFNKLDFFSKKAMNLMRRMLRGKKRLTDDEQGMLAAFEHPVDFTSKEEIGPLIRYVTS